MFEIWHVSISLLTDEDIMHTRTISHLVHIVLKMSCHYLLDHKKFVPILIKTFIDTLIYILIQLYQLNKLTHQMLEKWLY